jgi:hypothetical protein
MAKLASQTSGVEDTIFTIPVHRLILWLSLAAGAMLLILFTWAVNRDRYVVTVDVRSVDAPRHCWQDSDGGLLWGGREAERSRAPSRSYLGYCGGVLTSHGTFQMPETYPRPWLGQTRAEIFERIHRGCRYDVVVTASREPSRRDAGKSRRNPPVIRRVMFAYPC